MWSKKKSEWYSKTQKSLFFNFLILYHYTLRAIFKSQSQSHTKLLVIHVLNCCRKTARIFSFRVLEVPEEYEWKKITVFLSLCNTLSSIWDGTETHRRSGCESIRNLSNLSDVVRTSSNNMQTRKSRFECEKRATDSEIKRNKLRERERLGQSWMWKTWNKNFGLERALKNLIITQLLIRFSLYFGFVAAVFCYYYECTEFKWRVSEFGRWLPCLMESFLLVKF